ncbi:MAG: hypothetical protein FJW31_13980 [Acidobacteria bacterium]|nr:hypothetical protein [Acidobacteriota bacterium]
MLSAAAPKLKIIGLDTFVVDVYRCNWVYCSPLPWTGSPRIRQAQVLGGYAQGNFLRRLGEGRSLIPLVKYQYYSGGKKKRTRCAQLSGARS